ncbi:MAG TPA: MFS transporter [Candidatus Limnocylindria bacterium]|nr:MFS transporter [Candidatus Limnocylindria bacterium]
MPSYRGNIWRLFVAQALFMFLLWVPIWVIFLQQKGLSLTQIGLLEAFAWLTTAALEVPTGAIADRWGRKTSIALGSSLYALAMFLILTDALSPAFLLGYALWNSSFAFMSGADAALLYDTLKANGRESEAAKQSGRSLAIQQASQGIAALIGAALATIDITLCFTICGVGGLIASALVLTIKEPPRQDEGVDTLGYWKNLRIAIGIAARRPVVRALVLVSAAFSVVPLIVYYFLLQPYALDVGLPIAALGVVVVSVQATTVVASWLAHRASRFELTTVVSAAVALVVLATAMLGAFPSIPSIALMLIVALAPALVGPLLTTRLNDLIPSAQRATVLSMSALLSELGTAAAVPLLLWLADVIGPAEAIGLSAILFAALVVPLLIVWRGAGPGPTASRGVLPAG